MTDAIDIYHCNLFEGLGPAQVDKIIAFAREPDCKIAPLRLNLDEEILSEGVVKWTQK